MISPRRFLTGACALAVLLATAGTGSAAADDDPVYVNWPDLLPSWTDKYVPTSANPCVAGRPSCVRITIEEMQRRFRPLARTCSHQAIFSLAYLRTTQEYARAAAEPGFFEDPRFVNHEDAVFAKYYFDAYDAWAAGRDRKVPAAWRIAYDAAAAREVSGSGNLMLGLSAHVNRDLPFVLASIGLVKPNGDSRKPDHDKVNKFLNRVITPLLAESARRFDPTMDDTATPYGLSYTVVFQKVVAWRETAWRHAEQLVDARNDRARARVSRRIEAYAASVQRTLAETYQYVPPLSSRAARDAHCAARRG